MRDAGAMAKYPFLSDEWVAEARLIYAEAEASGSFSAAPAQVRVNLLVTEVPFAAGALEAHVDTSAGRVTIDTGHLQEPDVTVSLDYATARVLFVAGDVQAALQAFLAGRVKVDGDLTKLLGPHSGIWPASTPVAAEDASSPAEARLGYAGAIDLASRLQAITE